MAKKKQATPKKEFVVPTASGTTAKAGDVIDAAAVSPPAAAVVPDPAPEIPADAAVFTLPMASSKVALHLDIRFSLEARIGIGRLREGLRGTRRRLAAGHEPSPKHTANYLNLLFEMMANPEFDRVVFMRKGE